MTERQGRRRRESQGRQEKCPVCGKKWSLLCRRDEWGFWYNSSIDQLEGHLTLFCSRECAKEYDRLVLVQEARELMKTRQYKIMKMHESGLTSTQIGKILGIADTTVTGALTMVRDFHWRAWEFIQKHGEDLTA